MSARAEPRVVVCAGGGGVGKTSSSAALALAAARRGERVLVVTIDPARRLADALGVRLGAEPQEVALEGSGSLLALMPEPQEAMRAFVGLLFADDQAALQRVLDNRLYQVMEDAVPGIDELVAMSVVAQTVTERTLDLVVVDTAPSRSALDFITYPRRLAALLGGRGMAWLAALAERSGPPDSKRAASPDSQRRGHVQKLLEKGLGPVIYDVGSLSAELAGVLDRFVALNAQTSRLLLGAQTRYVMVAAPSGAAADDVRYLYSRLKALKIRPVGVLLNAALEPTPQWAEVLASAPERSPAIDEALLVMAEERRKRALASEVTASALRRIDSRMQVISLPFFGLEGPKEIVAGLANSLEEHLLTLTGR